MAAIIWSDVTDEAPELATGTSAGAQTLILAIVNGAGLNVSNFGGEASDLTKAARVFLAAHMATLARRRGVSGAVSSQSEGGVSQSYANLANPRTLDLTSYGNLLRGLALGTPARAGTLV
jgi:hypothetical protein